MKRLRKYILISLITLLAACSQHDDNPNNDFRVGVIAGPEAQLMDVARQTAIDEFGIDITVISFGDYNLPNTALCEKEIDANIFQHLPFLEQQMKNQSCELVPVARTFIFPMGLYSRQVTSLDDLPNGAVVAIPNDPTNEARALLLLQEAGLIKLCHGVSVYATVNDVSENPKQLVFAELDAAQLPRALGDASLAAINTSFAIPAGLSPVKDALFAEGKSSRYANLIVVRKEDVDNVKVADLVAAYQSPEVVAEAKKLFGDDAIAAW